MNFKSLFLNVELCLHSRTISLLWEVAIDITKTYIDGLQICKTTRCDSVDSKNGLVKFLVDIYSKTS